MNKTPLVIPALAMLAGVVTFLIGCGWWMPVVAVLIATTGLWLHRPMTALAGTICALGWIMAMLKSPQEMPMQYDGRHVEFAGHVTAMGEPNLGRSLDVVVDSVDGQPVAPFKTAVSISSVIPFVDAGQRVRIRATLQRPDSCIDLPGALDYDRILLERGVKAKAFVTTDSIQVMGYARNLSGLGMKWRRNLIDALTSTDLSTPGVAFMSATICADRSLMEPGTRRAFAGAGIAHLLAISGLHVALLALIVGWMLSPLSHAGGRNIVRMLTLVAIWGYAIVTGLTPSVVRAAVMITLLLAAAIAGKRNNPINSLAAALLLFLWCDPWAVTTPSFQLSFAATLSILVFARPFNPFNQRKHPSAHKIAAPLAATLAATLGTAVWMIGIFHTFPLMFLPANAIASLLAPPLLGGGFLLTAMSACGIHFHPLCRALDCLYGLIESMAGNLSSVDGALPDGLYLSAPTSILALLSIITLAWAIHGRHRLPLFLLTTFVGAATLMSAALAPTPRVAPRVMVGKRMGYFTNLLVPTRDTLYVASTARAAVRRDLEPRLEARYGPYLRRHGVKAMKLLPAESSRSFRYGDTTYILATSRGQAPITAASRTVVVFGFPFNGNAAHEAHRIGADSVILAPDLHPRVARRNCRELDTASVRHSHYPH